MNARWGWILRPSLKIQTLVMLWAVCMLLAWAILVGGWFLARSKLSSLHERVRTDVQELDAARELDSAILEHVREDLLWHATGLASHRERRDEYLREAERIAADLGSQGTTVQDREFSAQIEQRLQALPQQPAPPGEKPLEGEMRAVDDILGLVGRFQTLNEQQMSESIQATARLHEEAQRLRAIVHDLTDDIQVTTGRFSVQKAPVELCAAVRQLLQAQAAAFSDHRLVVEAREECTVPGDARRLQRVVMNLVSNAFKYSPHGTRVTVRIEKKAPFAILSVSDEGPGISEEDLSVLFQPFGRGRSAGATAEGTGIGLYVVKQIVEAHGGRIEVESEPGHGATFRVSLLLA